MPAFVKLGDIKADTANSVVVQPESLILPTDGDDILVVKPEANDILTGLDVGPVNKLADNGWWTVDGADFREPQKDSLTNVGKEGFTWEAASDIWTNGGASTYCTGYCLMDSSNPDGLTIMTETFEPVPGMDSFGESMNPFLEERSNWGELCDVGLSVRRAEMMPSFAIA